jgi:hypothetical protein
VLGVGVWVVAPATEDEVWAVELIALAMSDVEDEMETDDCLSDELEIDGELEIEGEELDWPVAELVLDTTEEALDWLAVELETGPGVEELLDWLLVELPLDKVEELLV